MKRNFLLMLLLTLLPFAGWSADVVKVGNYDVTLGSKFVECGTQLALQGVTTGDPAQEVNFEPGAIYGTDGKTVAELTKVGSYFQQIILTKGEGTNLTTESIYVPFMVVKSGTDFFNKEYIWNSATWNASVESGILKYYFLQFPWYDLYRAEPNFFAGNFTEAGWNALADAEKENYTHDWKAIAKSTVYRNLMFPQINFSVKGLQREGGVENYENWEKYAVYATYKVRTNPGQTPAQYVMKETYTQLDEGKPALLPRGGYWMVSIPELYKDRYPLESAGDIVEGLAEGEGYVLKYADNGEPMKKGDPEWTAFTADELANNTNISNALQGDFAWDYVNLYLAPQEAPFKMVATLTNPVQTYSNSELDPGLVVYVGTTHVGPKGDTSEEGYTVTWYQDGEKVDKLINAGSYIGIVTYKENVAIVEFTIKRATDRVVIEPAYVEKVYGTIEDPDPDFEFTGTLIGGDNLAEAIKPFLVLKRSSEDPVATREDVGDHKYYIDFTDEYRAGKCNYEIKIIDNHSILKITPAPLSIEVTEATATKQYKKADPPFAYVNNDAMKNQLKFNDAEKASGTPGASDIITSITREKAGTDEGEVVGTQYKFTATSKNYKVTVVNAFVITPSEDLSGLKFKFIEDPEAEEGEEVYVEAGSYVYNGDYQTPKFQIIDTDAEPDYTLRPGVDYWATGTEHMPVYDNNKDVTTAATVTVTMAGNYKGTKIGTFAITKAPLKIIAKSYTSTQTKYEFVYDGFVNGETAETETAKNTTEVTYFKAPTANPVVTVGDEIESGVFELVVNKTGAEAKNYEISTENGLLALNGTTPIKVKATGFKKQYDGVDVTSADLKDNIAVYDANNEPILGFDKNKLKLANGPIYEIAKAATGRKHYPTANSNPFNPTYPTATGANEGYYDITLRGPSVIQGYTIQWVGLQEGCEIDFRSIVLKADDKTKVYGAAVPTLTAQVEAGKTVEGKVVGGLIAPDTEASIGLVNQNGYYVSLPNPPYSWGNNTWNINGEHATTYEVDDDGNVIPLSDTRYNITPVTTAQNAVYGNYRVTTAVGKLQVNKASVQIAAANATKQFGTADPDFTITVTPADDGTPASVATVANMNGFWTIARTDKDAADGAGETVGAHKTLKLTLTDAGKNAQNFNITASTENGTLTITQAELKVEAAGQWINYGEEINLWDVIIYMPSGDGLTKKLKWNKVTTDPETGQPKPLTDAQTKENNEIKALGHLEVLDGKMEIGTNYDAFKFVVDDANYVIAPDKQEGQQTIHGFTNNTLLVYPLTVIPLDKDMLAEILTNKALTPKTLTKVLQDHQGCTVDVILPRRPMKANDWYAWVLPFEVKQRDIFTNDKWGYGAIEPLDEARTTAKSVAFSLTVQPIPANTPFIVKVDQDIVATRQLGTPETTVAMDEIIMRGVEIGELNYLEENPVSGDESTVQFIGLYNETQPGDLDNSALTLRRYSKELPSSQWASLPLEWWPAASNVTLNRTYGYLQFPNANAAREAQIFIQEPDGSYTAINGVNADASVNNDAIYNLSGQRVNKAQKGIYIQNGKKVLVK